MPAQRLTFLSPMLCLLGAVFLEIYAFLALIFSDWTTRWLTKNHILLPKSRHWSIYSVVSHCESSLRFLPCMREIRWSKSITQYNLVDFCLKNRVTRCLGPEILFQIHFTLELYRQRDWKKVDDDLKALIFQQLVKNHELYRNSGFDPDELKRLLNPRWYCALNEYKCDQTILWSLEVEFDHSLLLWHIATSICYECDSEKREDRNCKASKNFSDYMFYILLMRPFMLPKWIDRSVHVRDTFKEAIGIFHRRQFPVKRTADACRMMLQLHTQCQPLESRRREKSSKSVFLDGCHLGAQLQQLKYPWEKICQVWIEMVTYAASHCEWMAHGQQLRRGGELLTHVCLLMAELGLSDQFEQGRQGAAVETKDVGWGWVRSRTSLLSDMKN